MSTAANKCGASAHPGGGIGESWAAMLRAKSFVTEVWPGADDPVLACESGDSNAPLTRH